MKAFCSVRTRCSGTCGGRIESLFGVKLAGDTEELFPLVRLGVIDGERDTFQLGMRFEHGLEHDMNLLGLERVGPSHLCRLPAKGAGAVDFPGFRRNPDVGRTLVALDQLQGKIRGGGEDLGIIGAAVPGPIAPSFTRVLALRQSSAVLIPLLSVVMHTSASAVGIPSQPNLRPSNCTAGLPIMCCKISGPDQFPMTVPSRGALLKM